MIPLDVYVDFTPVASHQLTVLDGDGVGLSSRWAGPPLGGGVDVLVARFESLDLFVSLDVARTKLRYDIALDWRPGLWSWELDFGTRLHVVKPAKRPFALDFEAGPGLRAKLLTQPWWSDYGFFGVGAHMGLVGTWGDGPVQALVGIRATAAVVPGLVQGVLDSSLQDLSWSWDGVLSGRIGVHAGVAFR